MPTRSRPRGARQSARAPGPRATSGAGGPRRVLLIADLEGITGVDDVDALVFGAPGHDEARARMTQEVAFTCRALLDAGWDAVRVVDSHLSGSGDTNLFPSGLHDAAEAFFSDAPFDEVLFEGCAAVAALGFHAAAGRPGFAAHTVNLHSAWRQGQRWLSELDLLLGVASALDVPVLFASGDDVLERDSGGVPFVRTKRARSLLSARSRATKSVQTELAAACRGAGRRVRPRPSTALLLHFRSAWMADVGEAAGARRRGPLTVFITGRTWPERLQHALHAAAQAEVSLAASLRGEPGHPAFLQDVRGLLAAPWTVKPTPVSWRDVTRTCAAFLRLTAAPTDDARVLRALGLFLLRGFAPRAFRRLRLGRTASVALAALHDVPLHLDATLEADAAQTRVDAWFLRRAAGEAVALDADALARTVHSLTARGDAVYAWLLQGLSAIGHGRDAPPPPVLEEPLLAAYALTHRFLLETRYGQVALRHIDAEAVERLHRAVPWVLEGKHVDLAGELALCLLLVGEGATPDTQALLALMKKAQRRDGVVLDHSLGMPAAQLADHTTAVALVCLALAFEQGR